MTAPLDREKTLVVVSLAFLCVVFWGAVATIVYWALF